MTTKKAISALCGKAAVIALSFLGSISGISILSVGDVHAARPAKITWEDSQPRWDVQAYVLYMKEEGAADYMPVTTVPLDSCAYDPQASYPIKCETPIPYQRMSVGPKYYFVIRTMGPRGQMSVDSDMLTMALREDVSHENPPTTYTSVIPLNYDMAGATTTGDGAAVEKIINADSSESFALTYVPSGVETASNGVAWSFGEVGPLDTANYRTVYAGLMNMNPYSLFVDLSLRSQQTGQYWGRTLLLPARAYMEYNILLSDFRLGFIENPSDAKRAANSIIDELTFSIPPKYLQILQIPSVAEPIKLQSIYFSQ